MGCPEPATARSLADRHGGDRTSVRPERAEPVAATDDGELRSFYVDGEHEEGSPMQARPGEGDQATGRWLDLSVTPTGVSGLRDDGTLVRWRARPESRLARPLRPAEASGEMLALASTTDGVVTGVASDGTVRAGGQRPPRRRRSRWSAKAPVTSLPRALHRTGTSPPPQRRWQCAGPTGRPGGTAIAGTGGRAGASRGDLPNGTRLAIGSGTGAVALVEVGQEGMRLADHRQLFTSGAPPLAFSPDGDRLASADEQAQCASPTSPTPPRAPWSSVATPMASTR